MQCIIIIGNYNNTVNHGHTHVIIRMGTMHKHSILLFPVVIVFVCEILTAPAAVICLAASRNDYIERMSGTLLNTRS